MTRVLVGLRRLVAGCFLSSVALFGLSAARAEPLEMVFCDMEGGAATLIVTPQGESVLLDCGSRTDDQRDARRIAAAARALGVEAIDHFVITHYHSDHWGASLQLARLLPLRRFYDHGPLEDLPEDKNYSSYLADYLKASRGRRTMVTPGYELPLERPGVPPVSLRCVAARKRILGGPAPACSRHERYPVDKTDNARSLALVLEYGPFRAFLGGDITRNVEHDLVCPRNVIGQVDLYQVDHHGLRLSNNPVLCEAIDPTVAVMMNGPRKGAHLETQAALKTAPHLQAVYQIHENLVQPDANPPAECVANRGAGPCAGRPIRVTVDLEQGRFAVRVGLEGEPVWYAIRSDKTPPQRPAGPAARYTLTPDDVGYLLQTPDGRPVFRYMVRKPEVTELTANSTCCFYPVWTPGEIRAVDFASADHRHHRGIFLAWHTMQGKVAADFWGWGEMGPVEGRVIRNRSVDLAEADRRHAVLRIQNDWMALDQVMLREQLTATASQRRGAYVIDLAYRFTPEQDVTLNQTAFGGFCVKCRHEGTARYAGPEGVVKLPPPHYLKPETDWPDAAWYDYELTLPSGQPFGVAVMNHPDNPPTAWHNLGAIAMLNPCIVAKGPLRLAKGEQLTLRYRVVTHDGRPPKRLLDRLADQWRTSE